VAALVAVTTEGAQAHSTGSSPKPPLLLLSKVKIIVQKRSILEGDLGNKLDCERRAEGGAPREENSGSQGSG
jgi:hypothetical protein